MMLPRTLAGWLSVNGPGAVGGARRDERRAGESLERGRDLGPGEGQAVLEWQDPFRRPADDCGQGLAALRGEVVDDGAEADRGAVECDGPHARGQRALREELAEDRTAHRIGDNQHPVTVAGGHLRDGGFEIGPFGEAEAVRSANDQLLED